MTTFKQFLTEIEFDEAQQQLEEVAELIKRDCQPWLKEAGKNLFYRGLDSKSSGGYLKPLFDTDLFLKGSVRNDRRPKDSPNWLHDALNDYFISKVGVPLRSASLFVAADYGLASNYGKTYMIFPIGNFNYAWSKHTADPAYEMFMSAAHDNTPPSQTTAAEAISKNFMAFLKKEKPNEYKEAYGDIEEWISAAHTEKFEDENDAWAKFIKKFIKENDLWLFNQRLKDAASNKYKEHEVMVVCDQYYAVSAMYKEKIPELLF